jgi:tetratricopeptide (TPR) repeat protein
MRRLHPVLVSCIIGLCATFPARSAHAVDPAEVAAEANALTEKAGALYDEGVIAYQKSKWAEARASFLAAWSLKQHWQIAGNLADCELQLGRNREAAGHATYYLKNAPSDRRARAEKLLTAAKAKVATLHIKVDLPDAEVLIDGSSVGRSPLLESLFVDPGKHKLVTRLAGHQNAETPIDLVSGADTSLLVKVGVADSVAGGEPPPNKSTALLVGGVAVTALAIGAGTAFTLVSNGKANDADSLLANLQTKAGSRPCLSGKVASDCTDLNNLNKASDTFHNVAVASFVGAGILGAATLTYALWPAKKAGSGVGLDVSPILGGGTGGVAIRGRF